MRVSFLGLGVMGGAMAGHVLDAGHSLVVWNRSQSRAEEWSAGRSGVVVAATPAEAARLSDVVLMCVSDDRAIREVLVGDDGVLLTAASGTIVVDHSTTSAHAAREMAQACADRGVGFLDAPVSGGQAGAVGGTLTVMIGGAQEHLDRVEPVLETYSAKRRRLGDVGAGQLAKMVNQICIAGLVQALSEGVAFAQRTGQDVEAVFEAISAGAAGSWQMANRHQTMNRDEFEFGFAVEHMRKDLAICLAEAKDARAALPVTALVDQFYAEVVAAGGSRWDTSSLLTRLPRQRP
ncbi:MAG: NAD-binding protein [Actinobacteria bacterium]|uniref:Unannotated protein n=1 Tax=freshwater metagenome TaxID=449393 RepID=A0A6J7J6B4_9ZZZZ|nr:NAD-binding protein [Actinomycetota bacterium]